MMKNMLRWALCQLLGGKKGKALFNQLIDGELGQLLKEVDENAIDLVLGLAVDQVRLIKNIVPKE